MPLLPYPILFCVHKPCNWSAFPSLSPPSPGLSCRFITSRVSLIRLGLCLRVRLALLCWGFQLCLPPPPFTPPKDHHVNLSGYSECEISAVLVSRACSLYSATTILTMLSVLLSLSFPPFLLSLTSRLSSHPLVSHTYTSTSLNTPVSSRQPMNLKH